jgi:hypothetical protein
VQANVYYAVTADEQLAQAQLTLNTHVTSSATGRPPVRENAVVVFSRTLRLPRRRPGATRPELVGSRRVDGQGLRDRVT